jgi:hypothetical protein
MHGIEIRIESHRLSEPEKITGSKKVHATKQPTDISKLFIRNPEYRFWYVDNFG